MISNETFERACWFRPIHYALASNVNRQECSAAPHLSWPVRLVPFELCKVLLCVYRVYNVYFFSAILYWQHFTSTQSIWITFKRLGLKDYWIWSEFTRKYQAIVASWITVVLKSFAKDCGFPSLFLFWCICSATCDDHGWSHSFVPRSWEIWALWNLAISSEKQETWLCRIPLISLFMTKLLHAD